MPALSFLTFARVKYWPTASASLAVETRRTRGSALEKLVDEFGHEPLASLTPERVERWWAKTRARGRQGRTDNLDLECLRSVCRAAVRWGYLKGDPTAGLARARERKGRVRFFASPEERQRVLDAAPPTLRDWLVVTHYTAARRSSVWRLTAGDVDLGRGTLTLRCPKGSERNHVVPVVHEPLREVLTRRTVGRAPAERLFPEYRSAHTPTVLWGRLCARLGLKDFRLHDWRHDTLSWVAMGTGSLHAAQALAGHASPSMTLRYAHLADQYLRDALKKSL